jgi:S1-C subfamily serine protease
VDSRLSAVEDVEFPIDCRAEIVQPLGSIDDKIVLGSPYYVILNNSEALVDAAKAVLARVFKEVDVRGRVQDPHFVVKVKSDVKVDAHWTTYDVNVHCAVSYGDGRQLGTFTGRGSEMTLMLEQKGLDKAYVKAFAQVVDNMVADPRATNLLAEGVDETNIRVTSDVEDSTSEYQEFIDGVITIELKKKLPHRKKPVSMHGSGFFIDDKATILTNNHVISEVKEADTAKVLYKQEEYDFEILTVDEWNDLALIRVSGVSGNPYLRLLAADHMLSVGDEVIVVGSPMTPELEQTVSKGIISSFRQVKGYPLIQTDAAINPGNSGGPLVHVETQRVIGVVSLMAFGEGLGFAIPPQTIQKFLEEHADKY